MNGHGVGERAGWVFAAALVIVGSTSGALGDRPAPASAATVRVSNVGAAATALPAMDDRFLGDSSGGAPTAGATGPELALAADALGWPNPVPAVVTTVSSKPAPKPAAPAIWWSVYHGTNHVWMPTLGINRTVYSFPCSRGEDPANLVYRWGCAGTNNVYLLGHAWGVFKALHDAYYNGRLKVGMPVVYADGKGHVHLFRVTTWRVVSPTTGVAWAIASQSRLSMTLQTCIGANSQYRLNVRLVAVDH